MKTDGVRAIKNIEKILGKACKSVNILGDLEHSEIKEANEILIENLRACENHLNLDENARKQLKPQKQQLKS